MEDGNLMTRWIAAVGLVIAVAAGAVTVLIPSGDDELAPATRVEPGEVYDPVRAGEDVPEGFRQLLSRDSIRPIYDPQFVSAEEAPWTETTLVIGVEVDGDARAYTVAYLGRREMVNDVVGGEPLLVSW
jgi:hypothetical protein